MPSRSWFSLIFIALLAVTLVGCDRAPVATTTQPPGVTTSPVPNTPTPIPPTPTATPVPMAASINGEGLTLAEYDSELGRLQSSGTDLATDTNQQVLAGLVDRILLAQAAAESGYTLDDSALDERMATLEAPSGGPEAMSGWLQDNGFTPESFRPYLRRELAAAWMRDQIASGVPETAEQVHARQILLSDRAEADQVLVQLQAGSDFEKLAKRYDPVAVGDLGWFPRGFLTQPALDEPVFVLQPGEYTQVLETELGFHIIQVIERDPARPLTQQARLALQEAAVSQWLADRRSQSDIQVFAP